MKYRPEIDGLRALAVVPVILFHAATPGFSGGFVGVDIFFVLSGYLITSLIIEDHAQDRWSLATFYARRALRILPALLAVLLVSYLAGLFLLLPSELETLSEAVVASALFASNHVYLNSLDYFSTPAEYHPLLHTWSLAVEEQFYILFPPLLVLLLTRFKSSAFAIVLLVSVASFALAEFLSRPHPLTAFFILPTRFWELGAGALCALYLAKKETSRPIGWLALAGLLGIVLSIFLLDEATRFPSIFALPVVLGTVLFILFASAENGVGKLFSFAPLRAIGLVSFSAYLWHQPVFAFGRILQSGPLLWWQTALLIPLIFVLAALSWRFIEQPFRTKSIRQLARTSARSVLVPAAAAIVLIAAVGQIGDETRGHMWRPGWAGISMAQAEQLRQPNPPLPAACTANSEIKGCALGQGRSALLWGDSHAHHLLSGIAQTIWANEGVSFAIDNACPPVLPRQMAVFIGAGRVKDTCVPISQSVESLLKTDGLPSTVIISSRWDYLIRRGDEAGGREVRAVQSALTETVRDLLASDRKVVLLSPVPFDGRDHGSCPARSLVFGADIERCKFDLVDRTHGSALAASMLRVVMGQFENERSSGRLVLIDVADVLCPDGICNPYLNETVMFSDEDHLSAAGARELQEAGLYQALNQ